MATAYERARAYIAEQTALPTETIEAVLAASERFWLQEYPELANAAADLLQHADEIKGV